MKVFPILAIVALASGCASNVSPQSYSVGSVGQVNRTVSATVISTREVDITGTSNTGAGVGGATGGVAGSAIGGGRGGIVGAIAGAVVGAGIGAAIEANSTKQKGMEYVVETENGNLMSIVQGVDPVFNTGQKILVLYGTRSRIIQDPRAMKGN